MNSKLSRRNFLKGVTAAGTVFAVPAIIPFSVFGANAPSNRVALGHIGVGGQGGGVMNGMLHLEESQILAVCDCFSDRRESRAKTVNDYYAAKREKGSYKSCEAYRDFREMLARSDIDAVVIATPDHWHVPAAVLAVRAGKDVYVEKPLGISIAEDKLMREVIHKYGAIFQYGTQQRCFNQHCGFACELVRNGYLGELKAIHVIAPNGATGGNQGPQPVPEGLDYDMWLGPAPVKPYTTDRVVGGGRWHIYDYALGFIAGWGAHPLDIAHWGYPHIPVEYEGTGLIPKDGLFDTIVDWDVKGRYASGVEFTLKPGGDKTTFVGTEGWIAPSRGTITAEPETLLKIKIKPDEIHLLQDVHHYRNFLTAVKTRRNPASDIDSAVQSDFISQLGDIAIRTGRKIKWNLVKETIVGDKDAARMMNRARREPWGII
ncbi:MAG: Gfo/Idh/MocA family oxidoreductase [Kiritimatiellae bacterium]|nr:Gfo/Idh/MocA family oxidoreductase [Kiritimatiellia bacterium]